MFDMAKMMAQAQKMQKRMEEAKNDLENSEFDGEAAGGKVKVRLNGRFEFSEVKIAPEFYAEGDAETMEAALMTALNDATEKIKKTTEEKMKLVTSGMNIPGLKLPF